ncbi:family 16 glycosylhydrolase [Pseudomonas putida]|nr:family 16 glycosylhydrolase [Pseudomonas putida]
MWKIISVCVAVVLGGAGLWFSGLSSEKNYFVPEGVSDVPIFSDEFEGPKLDTTKWAHRLPGLRNHCVTGGAPVWLQDGFLKIRTFSDTDGNGTMRHNCGMLSTQNLFMAKYGYWEASVRFKRQPGVQLAFWVQSPTMGAVIGKPEESGVEIDVFEHLSSKEQVEYDHAFHWDGYGEFHKTWAVQKELDALADGQFHQFGVLWTPDKYEFYVDGQLTQKVESCVPRSATEQFIILSSEIPRRDFPEEGYGDRSHARTDFDVDYVRVYPLKN